MWCRAQRQLLHNRYDLSKLKTVIFFFTLERLSDFSCLQDKIKTPTWPFMLCPRPPFSALSSHPSFHLQSDACCSPDTTVTWYMRSCHFFLLFSSQPIVRYRQKCLVTAHLPLALPQDMTFTYHILLCFLYQSIYYTGFYLPLFSLSLFCEFSEGRDSFF